MTGIYFNKNPGNPSSRWKRITRTPEGLDGYSYFGRVAAKSDELYACGWQGIAHGTVNGPWELQQGTYNYSINDIIPGPGGHWAVGGQPEDEFGNLGHEAHGAVYRCLVGETNWVKMRLDGVVIRPKQRLTGIAELHGKVFVVGDEGLIMRGTPQRTDWLWEALQSGVRTGLEAIAAVAEDGVLWVVGTNGTILKSEDDGESWRPIPCRDDRGKNVRAHLTYIRFSGHDDGWILGQDIVLKYEPPD